MKKGNLILAAAVLAAGAYAMSRILASPSAVVEAPSGQSIPTGEEGAGPAPTDGDDTVAYPLKNKLTHQAADSEEPTYIFELETPSGVKELKVTWAHYETYYIGDEVICRETPNGLEVV